MGHRAFVLFLHLTSALQKFIAFFRVLEETFAMVPHRIVQVSQIH